jgi:hypothetical protein
MSYTVILMSFQIISSINYDDTGMDRNDDNIYIKTLKL